jgi:hypothetical protein
MILISLPIALIAIVFGAKLLAQSQKENLGGLYKFLSWFVIVLGLLIMLCDLTHGFMRMCHRGCDREMMNKNCMMMDRCDDGMMYHHGGNMNCCNGMMNCQDGGNCNGMMNCTPGGSCNNSMMNCKDDGKGSSCSEGGMSGNSCPMMGHMKDKTDSTKTKK